MTVQATGLIFDIQDFSVQDGPGIRTTVFLKGCPLRCRWCANPEGQAHYPELMHSRALCRGCLQCLPECPQASISCGADGYPQFQRSICHRCRHRFCANRCQHRAIRIAGRQFTVPQVIERIRRNAPFYRNSGGGITLSGGEPLSQPHFVRGLLDQAGRASIPVGVETCGHFHWGGVRDLIAGFEFIYFDVKSLDSAMHKKHTGRGNEAILENLASLAQVAAERITVSVPVIPGFNGDERHVLGIAAFARGLGIARIRLLPYHDYGSGKYRDLGRECGMSPDIPIGQETLGRLQDAVRQTGLECWVE
jgi:pyruvate formate lyase activating enzyme